MKGKVALVFGATGLIGKSLVHILAENKAYTSVKVFLRKEISFNSAKVEVIKTDFAALADYSRLIQGDDLFCCLGTTIKKAGSQEAFKMVDYTMVVQLGEIAKANQIKSFTVISSLGANPGSSNFYLQIKGKMEEALKKLQLKKLVIVRPSILLGKREEFRLGESIGKIVMNLVAPILIGKLRKFRPVKAEDVARAMICLTNSDLSVNIIESDQIQAISAKINQ